MILVDTSVWIDFLEGGTHWTRERLKAKIQNRESLVYTELILLEILQGIRQRKDRESIEEKFRGLLLLPHRRSTTMLAAEIHQKLQRKGKRIRSMVDCLIAATAIEHEAVLLHKDRDFDFIAEYYPVAIEQRGSFG